MDQRDYWTLFWQTGMPEAWMMSRGPCVAQEKLGGSAAGLFAGSTMLPPAEFSSTGDALGGRQAPPGAVAKMARPLF